MNSDPERLVKRHPALTHSDMLKVISHVQRDKDDWVLNTLMVENCDVPFRYRRRKHYKNLRGQRVNLTYYPAIENVAGLDFDYMKVVRIRIS